MKTHFIAALRRPDGLYGLITRRVAPFQNPQPAKEAEAPDALAVPAEGLYIEELRPLAEVYECSDALTRLLLDAWEALRCVTTWNGEVLANVLTVLIETIPDPAAEAADIEPLAFAEPPPPPRPTAAHPRAFRGTKYKPPKPPQPAPVDLRPHLYTPSHEARLLAHLSPHFEDAIARLARVHPYAEVVGAYGRAALYPYGQCCQPDCRKQIAALPPMFRRYLLFFLRAYKWATISQALGAYYAMDLEHDARLRSCICTLAATRIGGVRWLSLIAHMPAHRRAHFADLLIELEWRGPWELTDELAKDLLRADALCSDAVYRHRMHYALKTAGERKSLRYALDGFALANEFEQDYEFKRTAEVEGAGAAVSRVIAHVRPKNLWSRHWPMQMWRSCGQLRGFPALLAELDWQRLDSESASELASLFMNVQYEGLPDDIFQQKWQTVREHGGWLLESLAAITIPYRPKALLHWRELLWIWDDDVDGLRRVLEPYSCLLAKIAAPPFSPGGYDHFAITDLTFIAEKHWPGIEKVPDENWQQVHDATRRRNDALLIGRGFRCLAFQWPELTTAGLNRAVGSFLRVAKNLGALHFVDRDRLIDEFRKHTLISETAHEDPCALAELAAKHVQPGIADPIPKRLKEHLRGQRQLTPAQVERDVALIRENWLALQLDVLNQLAFDRLSRGLPAAERDSKVRHALLLQRSAEDNRRALRRLLKAYFSGDRQYAETHPPNQRWLARHPRLDAAKWLHAPPLRCAVKDQGTLELALERDALEVLRLGSYFGTCLGVGGDFSYSAAAIALDVNKQVIYARDARGAAVARQLVAVSEDDRLVCFRVYPRSAPPAVRAAFREFDRQLAAHLGIAIYENSQAGDETKYKIAETLSSEFYDDEAWDLRTKYGSSNEATESAPQP